MTREETLEAIKVMQHYADGGEVEYYDCISGEWLSIWLNAGGPIWDWADFDYRIKVEVEE